MMDRMQTIMCEAHIAHWKMLERKRKWETTFYEESIFWRCR